MANKEPAIIVAGAGVKGF